MSESEKSYFLYFEIEIYELSAVKIRDYELLPLWRKNDEKLKETNTDFAIFHPTKRRIPTKQSRIIVVFETFRQILYR